MRANCSKCGAMFESLIINQDLAQAEVFRKLLTHAEHNHKDNMDLLKQGIVKCNVAMAFLLTVNEMMHVPESETYLKTQIEVNTDLIMSALGYDEDEEEVEEVECRLCTKVLENNEETLREHLKSEHPERVNSELEGIFRPTEDLEEVEEDARNPTGLPVMNP